MNETTPTTEEKSPEELAKEKALVAERKARKAATIEQVTALAAFCLIVFGVWQLSPAFANIFAGAIILLVLIGRRRLQERSK